MIPEQVGTDRTGAAAGFAMPAHADCGQAAGLTGPLMPIGIRIVVDRSPRLYRMYVGLGKCRSFALYGITVDGVRLQFYVIQTK